MAKQRVAVDWAPAVTLSDEGGVRCMHPLASDSCRCESALSDSVDRDRVLNLTQTEMASAMHVSGSTHPFNLSHDEPLDIVMEASRGERM